MSGMYMYTAEIKKFCLHLYTFFVFLHQTRKFHQLFFFFQFDFRSAKTTSLFKLGKGRKSEEPVVVFQFEIW
jgi:hypothetical protein